jgi:NADPH:quinone reductase-like Zn-dependent oxidoreductase
VVVRAAGIRSFSEPVQTIDVPDPRPLADDEALIEVRAAGVANWDDVARRGEWDLGVRPPMALGVAGAGVVAAVGGAVEGWSEGEEVLTHPAPLRAQGSWAPWLIAPVALLARKPRGVTWDAAAVLPVPALTAEQVLFEVLEVGGGERLLVQGGSGVTGGLLVALAAIRGADVIATASRSSHQRLVASGVSHVLDYHDGSWPAKVKEITDGAGVDAAVNASPGAAAAGIATVRDGGRFATITSDRPEEQRGIAITTFYVRPDGPQLQRAADLLGEHKLAIDIGWRFPLDQAARALDTAVQGGGGRAVALTL